MSSANLSREAIELFRHQWSRRLTRPHHVRYEDLECSLHWLMPELLRLAQEFGDAAAVRELRPLVRRRVEDLDSATQPALHDEENAVVFECYIDTLVLVLAEVRHRARARGQWHCTGAGADAAPIMCG